MDVIENIESQPVAAKLSRSAIFLVATINEGSENADTVRAFCADLSAFVRAVGFRDLDGGLSCVMGFGSEAWDRLFGSPRPKELHPFQEIHGVHHAVSTPGDLLFHIRATQMDQCFELALQMMERLRPAITVVDETHGFKYFDDRDLLGFVDGTENPTGRAVDAAAIIGSEDPDFAGGSYVIVQKYLHDLPKWNDLPVEQQEGIIGRKKLSDIESATAKSRQKRSEEKARGDERAGRIAGQPQNMGRAETAVPDRFPGLHGDAGKSELEAERDGGRPGKVTLTARGPAKNDDDVG